MAPLRHLINTARRQDGFTIVEVMVAALLVAIGVVAILGSLDAISKTGVAAQRHQQAVAYGQREIERLRTLDYRTELGLTSLPAASGDGIVAGDPTPNAPKNPNYYVSGTGLKIMAQYSDKTSGLQPGVSPNPEPLVGAGESGLTSPQVDPGPQNFSINGTSGKIYRYVTWRSEHCPAATTSGITNPCPGTKDSKRITIAIMLDAVGNGAGPSKPIWLSSVISDPDATPTGVSPPSPPTGGTISAQTLFLTDTPCSYSSRQAIIGSHATHDTSPTPPASGALTSCAAGGAIPDLMFADPNPDAPTVPAYDYSSEVSRPAPSGLSQPAGLALRRGSGDCPTSYATANASTLASTVHTWATTAMPSGGFTIPSGSRAGVSLWTQTTDGATGRITLCATLRDAQTRASIGQTAVYDLNGWPTTPSLLTFTWDVAPTAAYTLPAGDRLLLTLSLQASTANKDALLLYDHPSFQSSLTVATTTPLP
jgi:prepilin-type N-terminal cleavage/methylation domain-containing protein